jgi:RNA recognition motif-containing protein
VNIFIIFYFFCAFLANVKNLKIIRDKTKSSAQGYGFIEFESAEVAGHVLEEMSNKPIPDTNK